MSLGQLPDICAGQLFENYDTLALRHILTQWDVRQIAVLFDPYKGV